MYFETHAELPVSIDLETAGLGTNAPIIAIGAVRFVPQHCNQILHGDNHEFHCAVNLVGQPPIDPSTFYWWLEQSKQAQVAALESKDGLSLGNALRALWQWLQADTQVIGHKSNFTGKLWIRGDRDAVWLEEAYKREGIKLPYTFRNVQDQRTMVEFAEERGMIMPHRSGVAHDALEDARYQAECLQMIFEKYPE